MFATKKDGNTRFCVYYRKLNAVTKRDLNSIPRMDECIEFLGDATVFSMLDANRGYRQIRIDKADGDKTALTPHHRLYRFI